MHPHQCTSTKEQAGRQAERKLHILSATVFILVNRALSVTVRETRHEGAFLAGGALILYRVLYWIICTVVFRMEAFCAAVLLEIAGI